MSDRSGSKESSYTLVEVSGQVFAIPLADVVSVQRLKDDSFAGEVTPEEKDSRGQVQTIDLRYLLGNEPPSEPAAYVVVVSTSAGTLGLLVDAIKPFRGHQGIDPLPRLLAPLRWLFAGIMRDTNSLLPIINVSGVMQQVYKATP